MGRFTVSLAAPSPTLFFQLITHFNLYYTKDHVRIFKNSETFVMPPFKFHFARVIAHIMI